MQVNQQGEWPRKGHRRLKWRHKDKGRWRGGGVGWSRGKRKGGGEEARQLTPLNYRQKIPRQTQPPIRIRVKEPGWTSSHQ